MIVDGDQRSRTGRVSSRLGCARAFLASRCRTMWGMYATFRQKSPTSSSYSPHIKDSDRGIFTQLSRRTDEEGGVATSWAPSFSAQLAVDESSTCYRRMRCEFPHHSTVPLLLLNIIIGNVLAVCFIRMSSERKQ